MQFHFVVDEDNCDDDECEGDGSKKRNNSHSTRTGRSQVMIHYLAHQCSDLFNSNVFPSEVLVLLIAWAGMVQCLKVQYSTALHCTALHCTVLTVHKNNKTTLYNTIHFFTSFQWRGILWDLRTCYFYKHYIQIIMLSLTYDSCNTTESTRGIYLLQSSDNLALYCWYMFTTPW